MISVMKESEDFLNLKLTLSPKEKEECISVALEIIKLSDKVQKNGISLLDKDFPTENNFIKIGISLLVNCASAEVIEKIFRYHSMFNEQTGVSLLTKLLIVEGLTAIYEEYTPFLMAHLMASIMGEEHLSTFLSVINKDDYNETWV